MKNAINWKASTLNSFLELCKSSELGVFNLSVLECARTRPYRNFVLEEIVVDKISYALRPNYGKVFHLPTWYKEFRGLLNGILEEPKYEPYCNMLFTNPNGNKYPIVRVDINSSVAYCMLQRQWQIDYNECYKELFLLNTDAVNAMLLFLDVILNHKCLAVIRKG